MITDIKAFKLSSMLFMQQPCMNDETCIEMRDADMHTSKQILH